MTHCHRSKYSSNSLQWSYLIRLFAVAAVLLSVFCTTLNGQTQLPTPSREYIRLGGRVIAIENGETVSTPTTPAGPQTGTAGATYTYATGGSASSAGHDLQYQFSWGDGTYSGWLPIGTTSASHTWTTTGAHVVTVQARCAAHTAITSSASGGLTVTLGTMTETVSMPATPTGPQTGTAGATYVYSTAGSTSSAGHSIQYQFNWGDGTYSGWLAIGTTSASHNWSTGTYTVTVQARCATDTAIVSTPSGGLTVTVGTPTETVSTPNIPAGPQTGTAGISFTYSTGGATSSTGHTVQYQFNWGDGTYSGWLPVGITSASHTWSSGTYTVTVQARCANDTAIVSSVSVGLTVTMATPTLPVLVSMSCPSTGTTGTCSMTVRDSQGAANIQLIQPYLSSTYPLSVSNGCHMGYYPQNGKMLYLDSAQGDYSWSGGSGVIGQAGTLSNGICQINLGSSSESRNGTDLTLNVAVTLLTSNTRYQFLSADNNVGTTDWQYFGTWPETISTPSASGSTPLSASVSGTYMASGASSSQGHTLQYRFTWGDGTDSGWLSAGVTSATHSWSSAGTYAVTVQARCSTNTSIVSSASAGFSVVVNAQGSESVSAPAPPSGPTTVAAGLGYAYSTGGAFSSLGHPVQYRFFWGDGIASDWMSVSAWGHAWPNPPTYTSSATYSVFAEARCQYHPEVTSGHSSSLPVTVFWYDMVLPNTTQSSGALTYRALNSITNQTDFVVSSGASVTFSAGRSIRMAPGFRATAGTASTTFRAVIQ